MSKIVKKTQLNPVKEIRRFLRIFSINFKTNKSLEQNSLTIENQYYFLRRQINKKRNKKQVNNNQDQFGIWRYPKPIHFNELKIIQIIKFIKFIF